MEPKAKKSKQTYNLELLAKYTKYATDNKVFCSDTIPTDTRKLVSKCNKHRQNYLLYEQNSGLGHRADTPCWNTRPPYGAEDSDDECHGFYTNGDLTCNCGNYWVWDADSFDPADVMIFTIDDIVPYGDLSSR